MGLDIYAGTLTRYYAQNWKTVTQQYAEEQGWTFQRITPNGPAEPEEKMDPAEIQADMESWRDQILAMILSGTERQYTPWQENNEKPYYTDKPDWDAFGALLVYAAAVLQEKELPPVVEKNWDFNNHPLILGLLEDEERVQSWSLFQGVTWWLPIEDSFYFQAPLPTGDTMTIATTGLLMAELKRINELGWKADDDTILSWSKSEGYPADMETAADGTVNKTAEHNQYDTESLAKFAFSIMWQAAGFSMEQGVPLLMDY